MKNKPVEPYRVLFPLGVFGGVWGAALWIIFGFGFTSNYPGIAHPDVMIGGFLFAFASGFLMTAIPRFTGSFPAEIWEIITAAVLVFLIILSDGWLLWFPEMRFVEIIISAANILFVMMFAFRRFRKRTHQPPPSFVFVGVGLFLGFLGTIFILFSEMEWFSPILGTLGRNMYYQGFMLALILGVGSKLVPALLGWSVNPLIELSHGQTRLKLSLAAGALPILLALVFLFSFPLDLLGELNLGAYLRAAVTTVIAFLNWKIHRKPPTSGNLSLWLRVAGMFLVVGLWGNALFINYRVHFLHIALIGGFSLFTILIATRVTLSHGGHDMSLERTSRALKWSALFICCAAMVRLTAPMVAQFYAHHLAYAAVTWSIGLMIWAVVYVRKMVI